MPKLWLTYAWKDNDDQDVDHVINELKGEGIEVLFDRAHLLAGQRLWEQIDKGINDPTVDGWAIYTTENSLNSEPCQEEIAYALDRTLRTKGAGYPLFGIFPRSLDRSLVPSALATRLFVNLTDPTWKSQIADSLKGKRAAPDLSQVKPYVCKWHDTGDDLILEMRPRSGRWTPAVVLVEGPDRDTFKSFMVGPRDYPNMNGIYSGAPIETNNVKGFGTDMLVNSETSIYASFHTKPTKVMFGEDGSLHTEIFGFGGFGTKALNFSINP